MNFSQFPRVALHSVATLRWRHCSTKYISEKKVFAPLQLSSVVVTCTFFRLLITKVKQNTHFPMIFFIKLSKPTSPNVKRKHRTPHVVQYQALTTSFWNANSNYTSQVQTWPIQMRNHLSSACLTRYSRLKALKKTTTAGHKTRTKHNRPLLPQLRSKFIIQQ